MDYLKNAANESDISRYLEDTTYEYEDSEEKLIDEWIYSLNSLSKEQSNTKKLSDFLISHFFSIEEWEKRKFRKWYITRLWIIWIIQKKDYSVVAEIRISTIWELYIDYNGQSYIYNFKDFTILKTVRESQYQKLWNQSTWQNKIFVLHIWDLYENSSNSKIEVRILLEQTIGNSVTLFKWSKQEQLSNKKRDYFTKLHFSPSSDSQDFSYNWCSSLGRILINESPSDNSLSEIWVDMQINWKTIVLDLPFFGKKNINLDWSVQHTWINLLHEIFENITDEYQMQWKWNIEPIKNIVSQILET